MTGLVGCVVVVINCDGQDCRPFDSLRSLRAGFLLRRPPNDGHGFPPWRE